jgi:hypothetical protein
VPIEYKFLEILSPKGIKKSFPKLFCTKSTAGQNLPTQNQQLNAKWHIAGS